MAAHPGITEPPAQAFMGVQLQDVDQGFRNQTNYHGQGGVAIIQVISGSPADAAGLQPGDVILQMNGKPYTSAASLKTAIGKLRSGDKVQLELWQQTSGAKRLAQVTLGSQQDIQQLQQQPPDQQ